MIRALAIKVIGWLPDRDNLLPFLHFFFEIGVVLAFVFGLQQAVTGFVAEPYLLIAFLGVWLPRVYHLREGFAIRKVVFLLLTGMVGVLISTLRIWDLLGWLVANFSSWGAYLPQENSVIRFIDQMKIYTVMGQRLLEMINNFSIWFQYIIRGNSIQVNQITMLLWGTVVFLSLAWFGWQLHIRRKPFLAAILPIVMLGIASEFSNQPLQFFALLFTVSLFIVVVFSHAERERGWAAAGYGYSLDIRPDLWGVTAMVCVMAFLISIFPPRLSVRTLLEKWELIGTEEESTVDIASGLGLSQLYPDPEVDRAGGVGTLPSSHLISNPPEELDTHLFDVWVGEETPVFSANWRTHTYQTYTGHGWLSGDVYPRSYPADEVFRSNYETYQVNQEITIWTRSRAVEGKLIHAYQLVQAKEPVDILWRDGGEVLQDYSLAVVGAPLYTVEVSQPVNTIVNMQESGFIYPDWVRRRYLQLPVTLPEKVRALGEEFASQHEDPFSRARAIESYLREFPYNLEVPTPPEEEDVVAYFLFDLQEGYCDYFATAMTVLARSAGLPARVVGGFATGEYLANEQLYRVTAAEAHTWVEIYFSGIGWVEFEPTPSQPLREYLVRAEVEEDQEDEETLAVPVMPDWRQVLIWTAAALTAPILMFVLWDLLRFVRLSRSALLTWVRDRLYRIAAQLEVGNPHCLTPGENRRRISEMLDTRFERNFPRFLLRNAREVVSELVYEVEDAAFRGVPVEQFDKLQLVRIAHRAARISRRISLMGLFKI